MSKINPFFSYSILIYILFINVEIRSEDQINTQSSPPVKNSTGFGLFEDVKTSGKKSKLNGMKSWPKPIKPAFSSEDEESEEESEWDVPKIPSLQPIGKPGGGDLNDPWNNKPIGDGLPSWQSQNKPDNSNPLWRPPSNDDKDKPSWVGNDEDRPDGLWQDPLKKKPSWAAKPDNGAPWEPDQGSDDSRPWATNTEMSRPLPNWQPKPGANGDQPWKPGQNLKPPRVPSIDVEEEEEDGKREETPEEEEEEEEIPTTTTTPKPVRRKSKRPAQRPFYPDMKPDTVGRPGKEGNPWWAPGAASVLSPELANMGPDAPDSEQTPSQNQNRPKRRRTTTPEPMLDNMEDGEDWVKPIGQGKPGRYPGKPYYKPPNAWKPWLQNPRDSSKLEELGIEESAQDLNKSVQESTEAPQKPDLTSTPRK